MNSGLSHGLVAAIIATAVSVGCVAAMADEDAPSDETAATVSAILAIEADPAFGAYLAGECVTCHRASGAAPGIPPIAGLAAETFVTALVEYRAGIRENEVMRTTAARLKDEEIAALAAHFSAVAD